MTRTTVALFGMASLYIAGSACGDAIVVAGVRHDNVYVLEGARALYVCNPLDGTSFSVAKSDPTLGTVTLATDAAERSAMYAEFKARKTAREREALDVSDEALARHAETKLTFEMGSRPSPADNDPASNRDVPVLELRGEPRVAPPEIQEIININVGVDSPKQSAGGGGGGGFGGGGGVGGGGMGGGLAAGGGAGGGFGGGAAGGGAGGRGGGGGAAGGGGGGTGGFFSNISELFGTIDDAEVGETPNPITGR